MTVIVVVIVMGVILGKRGPETWMNRLDLMRLSFWSTCESLLLGLTDGSFLFTLEEFGREVLFLLDTVEEVSHSLRPSEILLMGRLSPQKISPHGVTSNH